MNKTKFLFFDNLKRFFKLNKTLVIIVCSLILLSFLTGFFCTIKLGQDFNLLNLQSFILKKLFTKKISFVGFFFLKSLVNILILTLIFFLSFFKVGQWFLILILGYLTYLLGIDSFILIKYLGFLKGAILFVICYIPCQFLIFSVLYVFLIKLISVNKQISCYGNCFYNGQVLNFALLVLIVISVLSLVQTFLLFLLAKFIVFI